MSKDLERSLKDRVKAIAKAEGRAFNDVWKALALERFLARLARSEKLDRFVFKGGFLLAKYLPLGRETADLDFSLTNMGASVLSIKEPIDEILSVSCEDGFYFESLAVQEMPRPYMNYAGYADTKMVQGTPLQFWSIMKRKETGVHVHTRDGELRETFSRLP